MMHKLWPFFLCPVNPPPTTTALPSAPEVVLILPHGQRQIGEVEFGGALGLQVRKSAEAYAYNRSLLSKLKLILLLLVSKWITSKDRSLLPQTQNPTLKCRISKLICTNWVTFQHAQQAAAAAAKLLSDSAHFPVGKKSWTNLRAEVDRSFEAAAAGSRLSE